MLMGIQTGDPGAVWAVNETMYKQHNPLTLDQGVGLAELFARLSKMNPKVSIVRILHDGDFVCCHTKYSFSRVSVGFEVFRYEEDKIVEHWDNLQPMEGDKVELVDGMLEGTTEISDLQLTDANRSLVKEMIDNVFIGKQHELMSNYIANDNFIDHNILISLPDKAFRNNFTKTHKLIAEGNFVLVGNEGYDADGVHSSFFDLFRLEAGKVVEHWDTTEAVPPESEWKNQNGKF